MSRRRLPIGLIAPVALVVLIVALGALQYRWVGQASERDRDQLRQSLDRRAREFADDFDRELGRAFQTFRPEAGFKPAHADRFAKQYDEWQTSAQFPGLIKTAYFAEAAGGDFALYRFVPASRRFEAVPWPAALQPVHARLGDLHARMLAQPATSASFLSLTATTVMPGVPAIVIPEAPASPIQQRRIDGMPAGATMMNFTIAVDGRGDQVVLELDRAFIASEMLPALTERHFPETGSDSFRVAITAGKPEPLFSRGLMPGQMLDPKSADATATLFGLRVETYRTAVAGAVSLSPAVQGARTTVAPDRSATVTATLVRQPEPSQVLTVIEQNSSSIAGADTRGGPFAWTLMLQHSAGSLDAAVAQARRRNLFLSFGILGVLTASVGLVMINARRAERLAAQQLDFVATVSHELRTPLAVIRSAAQNLSAGVVSDPGHATRYGDLIESEGRRLTDMVEQVLEYAGLSDARRRPPATAIDVAPIVRDVVTTSASLAEAAGIAFDVHINPGVPPILADADAIRRVLHNLIGNALKHAGDGRWVGVTVSSGQGGDRGIVLVSVADRGSGIPAGDLSHIFEPFYRGRHALDQQIRGNGLGLSLVKLVVEAHGGRVSVKSTQGQGTTFTLHLPVATGPAAETV
jgi:signal transduction histidine kinase